MQIGVTTLTQISKDFGVIGEVIAGNMQKSLSDAKLGLSYDLWNKRFVVMNSAKISGQRVQQIIDGQKSFIGWEPHVVERRDNEGNLLIVLKPLIPMFTSRL